MFSQLGVRGLTPVRELEIIPAILNARRKPLSCHCMRRGAQLLRPNEAPRRRRDQGIHMNLMKRRGKSGFAYLNAFDLEIDAAESVPLDLYAYISLKLRVDETVESTSFAIVARFLKKVRKCAERLVQFVGCQSPVV